MKLLTDHIVHGDQSSQLTVGRHGSPGAGGAYHLYQIEGFDTATNNDDPFTAIHGKSAVYSTILFQNGPIPEKGPNGVTHEALLAIIIDRLRDFQEGPFACRENAMALAHIESGLMWLQKRTLDRMKRQVEGTHEK